MKKRFLSIFLSLALIVGIVPTAFAATPGDGDDDGTIQYVSIGDSMTNGLGLAGYADAGFDMVADKAYPNVVAENYDNWNLTQIATSGSRVEDWHFILEYMNDDVPEEERYPGDGWTETELDNGDRFGCLSFPGGHNDHSQCGNFCAVKAAYIQNAVREADVITFAAGNGNLGVYLLDMIKDALGMPGYGLDYSYATLENALSLNGVDGEIAGIVMEVYETVLPYLAQMVGEASAEKLANYICYAITGMLVQYDKTLDRIVAMNPDVDIIIVPLMNNTTSLVFEGVDVGELMEYILDPLNAYIAALPTAKQALGEWTGADFFYAEINGEIQNIVVTYGEAVNDRNSVIRARFVRDIGGMVTPGLTVESVNAYKDALAAMKTEDLSSYADIAAVLGSLQDCATYSGFENAIVASCTYGAISMNGLSKLGDFQAFDAGAFAAEVEVAVGEYLSSGVDGANECLAHATNIATLMGDASLVPTIASGLALPDVICDLLLSQFGEETFYLLGYMALNSGMGSHPSANGHKVLADAVIDAYDNDYTTRDEVVDTVVDSIENILIYVDENKDQIYADAYQYAADNGYIAGITTELGNLKAALDAFDEYEELNITPELKGAIDDVIEALYNDIDRVEKFINEAQTLEKFEDDILDVIDDFTGDMALLQALCEQAGIDGYDQLVVVYEAIEGYITDTCGQIYDYVYGMISDVYDDIVDEIAGLVSEYGPGAEALIREWLYENPNAVIDAILEYGADIDAFLNYWGRYVGLILGPAWEAYGDDLMAVLGELLAALEAEITDLSAQAINALVEYIDSLNIDGQIEEIADAVKDGTIAIGEETLAKLSVVVDDLSDDVEFHVDAVIDALEALAASEDAAEAKAIIETTIDSILDQEEELMTQIDAIKGDIAKAEAQLKTAAAAVTDLYQAADALVAIIENPDQFDFKATTEAVTNILGKVTDAVGAVEGAAKQIVTLTDAVTTAADSINKSLIALNGETGIAAGEIEGILTEVGADAEALMGETYAAIDAFVTTTVDKVVTDASALLALCELEVVKAVDAFIDGIEKSVYRATHGDYVVDSDSYYVSLGDSTVTGMGANNGEHPEGYGNFGYKTVVPASFSYKLAEKLHLDIEEQYIQLALAGLRTIDLRYILDESFEMDSYAGDRTKGRIDAYAGSLEQMRADYKAALEKADLITLSIGNCNFSDFGGYQALGVLSNAVDTAINEALSQVVRPDHPKFAEYKAAVVEGIVEMFGPGALDCVYHELKWDNYYDEEGMEVMAKTIAGIKTTLIEQGVPAEFTIDVNELADLGMQDPVNVTIPVLDVVVDVLMSYYYGYVAYVEDYAVILDKLHEIAPEAEVVVLGMYNPNTGLALELGDMKIELGEYFGAFQQFVNAHLFAYALANGENTTYVDVYGAESVFEAKLGDNTSLGATDFIFSLVGENSANHHATEAGHTYMAEQAYAALNVICGEHVWDEGKVTTKATCSEAGEKTFTCQRCGETRIEEIDVVDHNYVGGKCEYCGKDEPVELPTTSGPSFMFTDVNPSHPFYKEIMWAYRKGFVQGYADGSYGPSNTLTRQHVWMVLARHAGEEPADMAEAREWAMSAGVSDGTNPGAAVTRQQMVAMFYRYATLKKYDVTAEADITTYPDAAGVAAYAKDAMEWAIAEGIINGYTDGTLKAPGLTNRGQFAAVLYRFFKAVK